ncbi:disulfide bond formation protein B [Halococcus sp. AFM35]|uniref:disulfide bond formation protein B n=1 Tax=Halococcus sp. AFM35 TaxID=3421653 RepID=UPI003EBD0548
MRRIDTRPVLAAGTLVAVVATAGSLYFSEVLGLIPCELCWYQRILMYPLVLVVGVAALEDRPDVYRSALPLSALGTVVAAYHSYVQVAVESTTCTVGGCGSVQFRLLGLTIPNLSLVAFVLLSLALVVALRGR